MNKSVFLKATLIATFSISYFAHSSLAETVEATNDSARYPTEVIARPGIMPTQTAAVNLNAGFKMPSSTMKKAHGTFDLNTQFGIVNNLQGEFSYGGFAYNSDNFEASDALTFGLKYNLFSKNHISPSIAFSMPFHVHGDIVRDFTVGTPVVFYNSVMAGGILGNLLNLQVRPKIEAKFDFGFWYGYQVYGNLWAQVNSSFGSINMENKSNQAEWTSHPFWKKLPVSLEAIYAFNNYFDLGANIGFDDAFKAKDTFKFGLTFTARAGRIFG